jgi:Holliday junction resolvase RusA-like endonuclease
MPRTRAWDKAKPIQEVRGEIPCLRPGRGSLRFSVQLKPPSANVMYQIIYSKRQVVLAPEYRIFKTRFKQQLPPLTTEAGIKIGIVICVHMNWYYKNGNMLLMDVQNLEKAIIDSIFEHMKANDCQIWWKHTRKVQSDKQRIDVRLFAIK